MSKKKLIIILSCLIGVCLIAGTIVAIVLIKGTSDPQPNPPEQTDSPARPIQLETPTVTLQGDTAIWDENALADRFEINVDGESSYLESSITRYTLTDGQTFKVRAIGDQQNYTDSEWSNSVTYIAPIPTYTIIWKNGDVVLETDVNVEKGTVPTFDGAEPTKEPDAQYLYTFAGWTPEIVEADGDATYSAVFTSELRTYTVTWQNGDAILEVDENVPYGTIPSYDGTEPTKAETAQYSYEFSGWAPQISSVTESITYQAQFAETVRSYTMTFYSEDGSTVLDTVTVEYGSSAEYSKSTPVKNPSEAYTYVFEKWVTTQGGEVADDLSNVTGDRAVYASFKSFIRKVTVYIVTNNPDYGTVSVSTLNNVPYGSEIVVNGNTVSINGEIVTAQENAATAQFTYTFVDWNADATVGHDTIITANFQRTVNKYTVTWMNGDEVLEVDNNVEYGAMPVYNGALPTKAATAEFVYTFSGWSPTVSTVTGNVTYVAQFSKEDNLYTVTFYDDDGLTILGVAVVQYNTSATYPNATPIKAPTAALTFAFDKWVTSVDGSTEADLTAITANTDVYAKYTSEARQYTVTFCDWDGSVLTEQSVAYGQVAIAPENPYREDYRFDGWDVSFENIVADTRITATYVRQYMVEFVDYDNSIIEIQLIDHGADATQPADPVRKNHAFTGWNTTFTNIVSDVTVKAQYIRQYKVTFIDYDGTIISTDIVNSGDNATPPSSPTRVGYTFISWNQSYNSVTSDTEIVAVYEINRYTVTFVKPDGSIIETLANVAHGSTITPPTPDIYFDWKTTKGYRFTRWTDWDATQPIVGNMTVVAEFAEEITGPIIASETVKIAKGTNSAEISVYLCGTLDNIYGISLNMHFADLLVIGGSNSSLIGAETTVHADQKQFDLSWADGQGMSVSERKEILTLTFSIDKFASPGEYLVEMLAGTYIIDESLSKITLVVVEGQVIITE